MSEHRVFVSTLTVFFIACRPPDAIGKHIGLTSRKCQPEDSVTLLDETLRERFRQQVPGWRVQNNAAGMVRQSEAVLET